MRIAIIGAGPAGLSAAYELSKHNQYEVDLIEASSEVGGLCRSLELWGYKVDIGPHRFFSHDPEVIKLWKELGDSDYVVLNRQTRILYRDRYFHYPLKPVQALWQLGPIEAFLCILSYAKAFLTNRSCGERESFKTWGENRFGKRLFSIFFESYTEKLWGIPCSELDSEFGYQRIQKFSLWQALLASFGKKQNHKTLAQEFPFPRLGTGSLWKKASNKCSVNGVQIFTNTPVVKIEKTLDGKMTLHFSKKEAQVYDQVISTMPLTHLARSLQGCPSSVIQATEKLKFRNTILVYMYFKGTDFFPDQWLYVNSNKLKTGRFTNYNNWSPDIRGDKNSTVLSVEYWAQKEDPVWNFNDEKLTELAQKELNSIPQFRHLTALETHVQRVPKSYPIYTNDYKKGLDPMIDYLSKDWPVLTAIGRNGSFKYNNQDHSMKMGILAAKKIMGQKDIDLWQVNANNYYQESHKSNFSENLRP